ncbi:phage portal protein [Brucella sp. 6810]|nr:phage portal protein [Brucella sp. 6810]
MGNDRKSISETKALKTSDHDLSTLFGGTVTHSGVPVSGERALSIPAVLQAVRLISENIGSLPCKLYHDLDQGKAQANEHSAHRIVHSRANGWTSAGQLRADLTCDALIYGSGFAKIIRASDDRPLELVRLKPGSVSVYEDSLADLPPVYRVTEANGVNDYAHTEILHIKPFGNKAPTAYGREAIGLAGVLEEHGAKLFKGGARPPAVISREKSIPSDQAQGEAVIKSLRSRFAAAQRNGFDVPLILDDGWDYAQMALTSTDAQFLENRVFQIDDIARIFGIPPHMLFELSRATWSNAEQMSATFMQLCLRPWLDRWQDAYATVLLTEDEQDEYSFEFVIDDLQRADTKTRAEVFSTLVSSRVMTPNEVRAAMNMPPMEGGDELVNPFTTSTAAPVQSLDTAPATGTPKDISND